MLLRRAGNLFSEKKAIGDVPAVAAIISAIGRDAIDSLKLVQLKSNRRGVTELRAPQTGTQRIIDSLIKLQIYYFNSLFNCLHSILLYLKLKSLPLKFK